MTHEYRQIIPKFHSLDGDFRTRIDGTVWEFIDGGPNQQVAPNFNESGKPYLQLVDHSRKVFQYWLPIETFQLFGGVIPKGYEVYAIDNNKANFAVSNLAVRRRGMLSSCKVTNLPVIPKELRFTPPSESGPNGTR